MKNSFQEIKMQLWDDTRCIPCMDQEILIVAEDRLRLALRDYRKSVFDMSLWLAHAGICISLLCCLAATTSFRSFAGIAATTWEGIFLVLAGLSGIGTLWGIWRAWATRGQDSEERFLKSLKNPFNQNRRNAGLGGEPMGD